MRVRSVRGSIWLSVRMAGILVALTACFCSIPRSYGFEGEVPALPEDLGFPPETTYDHVHCPAVGGPRNLVAYVREGPSGAPEILAFCLSQLDDWLAPRQDPRLYDFWQCWAAPPTDASGQLSTARWCQPRLGVDGAWHDPAVTGQIYSWHDSSGHFRAWCDLSCHWPGD